MSCTDVTEIFKIIKEKISLVYAQLLKMGTGALDLTLTDHPEKRELCSKVLVQVVAI